MKKRRRVEESMKKIIAEQYINGKSAEEVAIKYDVSKAAVYKWVSELKKYGKIVGDTRFIEESLNGTSDKEINSQIDKLKKENEAIIAENKILKKTIAILIR